MASVYNLKYWNPEVFQRYVKEVPDLRKNAILNSGIITNRPDLASRLKDGVGGNLLIEPMYAPLTGDADNYDGATDIHTSARASYSQKKIVYGRAHAWYENDFTYDITGNVDFKATAQSVAKWFANVDEDALLAVLKGIFSMADAEGAKFVTAHTLDKSGETSVADKKFNATTLNTAIQKACGDRKDAFSLAIMHSKVATSLENLQVLEYYKYTDENGVQRSLVLGSVNGRAVIIDDSVPFDAESGTYTTYVLGAGAFEGADCGAKVPFEADRDPYKNGGVDYIIARERKLLAPVGISWKGASSIISPTDVQLATGSNWELAPNANGTEVYPHKLIAISRIITVE